MRDPAPRDQPAERDGPVEVSELSPVLDGASTLYVAIGLRSGPHVTPELFTVSGGRIICLTSATTLKARHFRHATVAGLCASSATSSAVMTGSVEIIDPMSPGTALRAPSMAVQAPFGVARFLRDNASEMVGATLDAVAGRLGRPLPPHRVVLAFTPISAIVTELGAVRLAKGWGIAQDAGSTPLGESEEPMDVDLDLGDLPGGLDGLAVSGPAVIGWCTSNGAPVALPVEWDADTLVATVPGAVFDTCGLATSGPACVTFSEWTGYGPSGKQGVMLRGVGTATRDGQMARITMEIGRASYWDGIETGTLEVGDHR